MDMNRNENKKPGSENIDSQQKPDMGKTDQRKDVIRCATGMDNMQDKVKDMNKPLHSGDDNLVIPDNPDSGRHK